MLKKVSVESVFLEFNGNADNIFSLKMSSPQISTFTTGTSKGFFSITILGSSEKLYQERPLRKPQARRYNTRRMSKFVVSQALEKCECIFKMLIQLLYLKTDQFGE